MTDVPYGLKITKNHELLPVLTDYRNCEHGSEDQ